jgi:hypothetical protein
MMTMLVATLGLLPARSVARHRVRFAAVVCHRDLQYAPASAGLVAFAMIPNDFLHHVLGERTCKEQGFILADVTLSLKHSSEPR